MGVETKGGGSQVLYRQPGGTLVPIGSRAMFRKVCNTWNRNIKDKINFYKYK